MYIPTSLTCSVLPFCLRWPSKSVMAFALVFASTKTLTASTYELRLTSAYANWLGDKKIIDRSRPSGWSRRGWRHWNCESWDILHSVELPGIPALWRHHVRALFRSSRQVAWIFRFMTLLEFSTKTMIRYFACFEISGVCGCWQSIRCEYFISSVCLCVLWASAHSLALLHVSQTKVHYWKWELPTGVKPKGCCNLYIYSWRVQKCFSAPIKKVTLFLNIFNKICTL